MRSVLRDLAEVLVARDPVPSWRWRAPWQQWAVYGVLSFLALWSGQYSVQENPFPVVWLSVAISLPFLLAVRYPLLGWRIGWLAMLVTPLVSGQPEPDTAMPWTKAQLAVLWLAVCVAGYRHGRRMLWWIWGLTIAPYFLWLWSANSSQLWPDTMLALGWTAVVVAVDAFRSRRRVETALVEQAELTELEQARRTILEERARIAREMHDVVAHHMSLIAVRAETAPYRLKDLPEPVREEFTALSGAAREALTDMRRLLGVLRDDRPAELAPQPQLSDLPALVDTAREAGVPVSLMVSPSLGSVPAGVGVCAYRIVQESLSNAGRHAPGSAVTVSVERNGVGSLALRVANGPSGASPIVSGLRPGLGSIVRPSLGHGLSGMRERVALLGGTLSAGPDLRGGFVVSAVLPLTGGAV